MSEWLFDDDPNYDGQGKSREEETDGAMLAAGCLVGIAALVGIVLLISFVLWLVL